jgi:UDP-N-acetylmuramyl pentapeptide synthase
MREIGEGSYEYHYRIGEYARDMEVKTLIAYGNESGGYVDGFTNGKILYEKRIIAEYILSHYCKRDAFLVKGSRTEKLEEIIYEMKELLK